MRRPLARTAQTIGQELAGPAEAVLAALADTARFNEAGGLPRHRVREEPQPDGSVRFLATARVGPFTLEHARTTEQLADAPGLSLDLAGAVATAFPRHDVDDAAAVDVGHGKSVPAAGIAGTYGVFAPDGRALALMSDRGPVARPVVVLAPAGS